MSRIEYEYICPKGGQFGELTYPSGEKQLCQFCHTELLETDLTLENRVKTIQDGTVEIINKRLFERYVKDNPLYDPDEAELSEAKFKHKKERNEARYAAEQAAKPHCPICNSTNVERIDSIRKGVSIAVFGLFSGDIGKTMVCNKCGYKF